MASFTLLICVQVTLSLLKYSRNEVMTSWTTDTAGWAHVRFPAVSICNQNKWKKSAVEAYFNGQYTIRQWDDLGYKIFRWGDDLDQFIQ